MGWIITILIGGMTFYSSHSYPSRAECYRAIEHLPVAWWRSVSCVEGRK